MTARTALITGAGRGIGAAIARRLAADGFRIAVVDLDADAAEATAASLRATGAEAVALIADVADEDAVRRAFARCASELGAPDVLVNNAGILRDNLLFRMSVADWDAVMGVHLRGAFLMSREAQVAMTANRWGRIITISSLSAIGNRGQANYSAAKAGLIGFSKTLAIELAPFGVTVNAVAPGYIETEMLHATATRTGVEFGEFAEGIASGIPVGRLGQPEDVAAAVSFFARDDAAFVTGQTLYVAGGPVG